MIKTPGAIYKDNRCHFTVWAPEKDSMILHIVHPADRKVNMVKDEGGYFSVTLQDAKPGYRYYYEPEGKDNYPDPASFSQPGGVHGSSEVIDLNAYKWQDGSWHNIPLSDYIIYEIHIGTFTKA